jgi:hypothetical protein
MPYKIEWNIESIQSILLFLTGNAAQFTLPLQIPIRWAGFRGQMYKELAKAADGFVEFKRTGCLNPLAYQDSLLRCKGK